MKRLSILVLLVIVSLLASTASPFAQSQTDFVDGYEVVRGEALVKFRSVSRDALDRVARAHNLDLTEDMGYEWFRVHSRNLDTATLLRGLNARPEVDSAEPNYILRIVGNNINLQPNDPSYGQLYGLENTGQPILGASGTPDADIDADLAWNVTTGSTSIAVGDIDTGIDLDHPDLAANVWTASAPYVVRLGGVNVTCPAGSRGVNTITNACGPTAPDDDNDHGSHTSGTVGAVGNNGVGVAGVNWTTRLIALKFLNAAGSGSTADAIEAVHAATDIKRQGLANVRVLNNSWGGGGFSAALQGAIARASDNDILFVASAGNNGTNNDVSPQYPASYNVPNVLAVAATNSRDDKANFSNYGASSVDLGAPGVRTLSTIRNGNYAYFNGTSMAAPHVSGAAALVLSACNMNTAALKSLLMSTVDPKPALAGKTVTGGRLNVNNAIQACTP